MVSSEGATGYWFIGKCVEPHSFICEFPRSGYTVPPTTPTTVQPQAQCEGPEWNLNDGHCYKYFDTPMPFTTAETFCKSKGGHLLSVNSQDEDGYWFANLEIYYQYIEIWIGLRQDEVGEGGYYWTDESPFDYTNFKCEHSICLF